MSLRDSIAQVGCLSGNRHHERTPSTRTQQEPNLALFFSWSFSRIEVLAHRATSMFIALQLSWHNPENVDEMYVKRHNASGNRHRSDSGGNQKRYAFGVRLTAWLRAGYPWFCFGTRFRVPTPDTLQQLDPLRQEPEHRMTGFAQRIRRIAPRPVNRLPAKTVARLRAVFCLRATIETGAKHHTQEHDSQAFNAEISGGP